MEAAITFRNFRIKVGLCLLIALAFLFSACNSREQVFRGDDLSDQVEDDTHIASEEDDCPDNIDSFDNETATHLDNSSHLNDVDSSMDPHVPDLQHDEHNCTLHDTSEGDLSLTDGSSDINGMDHSLADTLDLDSPPGPYDWSCAPAPGDASHLDLYDIDYVLIISLDGFVPDAIGMLGEERAPTLHRLLREGASTFNARADIDLTFTLPNHSSMATSRLVNGDCGHGVNINYNSGQTIHELRGYYVPSVFDVAHDHGLTTGFFIAKTKLEVISSSYMEENGWPDETGEDNGTNKIDEYLLASYDDDKMVEGVLGVLATEEPPNLVFAHFAQPDTQGHSTGFDPADGTLYLDKIEEIDGHLEKIVETIELNPVLFEHTAIIITSDHGGTSYGHSDPLQVENFTIPFIVWGPKIPPNTDLYNVNLDRRRDPLLSQFPTAGFPAIYNGEAGNLALYLLGLPPIPGSSLGVELPLLLESP